ncbi:MAG: hypothetical protein ACRDTJ_32445 [Pseudonocardiaceae bacterium]
MSGVDYEKLLEGARRVESGQGRETAGDSMDCDYGQDLIEEVLTAVRVEVAEKIAQALLAEAATYGHPNQWIARDVLGIAARIAREQVTP